MFEYERIEKDNTIRITGMRGSARRVSIPDQLDGHTVTEIGPYAFSGSGITLLDLMMINMSSTMDAVRRFYGKGR